MTNHLFQPPEGEEKQHAYHSQLEKGLERVFSPFELFVERQIIAGFLLFICTIIALIFASTPILNTYYEKFINYPLGVRIGGHLYSATLQYLVNDILLTLFFFVVGLEIKREFLVGELTNRRRAVLIIMAALGGMLVPALIYIFLNSGLVTKNGWGIPMATDTAFALGLLSMFRKHLPKGMVTFMATLAILDDIGAIIIIALFYTSHIVFGHLLIATLFLVLLIIINFAGLRNPFPYIFIGLFVWIFMELSGLHGTLAGILVSFTIPARPKRGPRNVITRTRELIRSFESRKQHNPLVLSDQKQHDILEAMQVVAQEATTPLQRWSHSLEMPVGLVVLPLFALCNAGIPVNFQFLFNASANPVVIGIILGLLLGKPIGIISFSWFTKKLKWGELPSHTSMKHITAIGILAGMGFTMSLFIANLAFQDQPNYLLMAKTGIIFGSIIAGIIGSLRLFSFIMKPQPQPTQ